MHVLLVLVGLLGRTTADLHRTGLVIRAVTARNQLTESAIAGEPSLEIVLLGGSIVQSAGDDVDHLVGDVQGLVELTAVLDHVLVHIPALLGFADHELLDLVELMHAENTPRVLSVSTGLLTEVGGETSVLQRQLLLINPLASMVAADGLLRGGDQVLLVTLLSLHMVELLIEVLQLGNTGHHLTVHEVGGLQSGISTGSIPVHGVHDDSLAEQNSIALQEVTTVTSHTHTTLRLVSVDHPEELVVAVHVFRHLTGSSPSPSHSIVVLRMRKPKVSMQFDTLVNTYLVLVDNASIAQDVSNLAQLGVALNTELLQLGLALSDLVRDGLHLGSFLTAVLAVLSLLTNLES